MESRCEAKDTLTVIKTNASELATGRQRIPVLPAALALTEKDDAIAVAEYTLYG